MDMDKKEAFGKLAAWCSAGERCESELVDKLMKWGIPPDTHPEIIHSLQEHGFLDEVRYCRAFVRDKFRFQKWGRRKISEALYYKKISRTLISETLLLIDPEEYATLLQGLLKAKNRSLHESDDYRRKSKLYRFAISRGFEPDIISRFITIDEDAEMD